MWASVGYVVWSNFHLNSQWLIRYRFWRQGCQYYFPSDDHASIASEPQSECLQGRRANSIWDFTQYISEARLKMPSLIRDNYNPNTVSHVFSVSLWFRRKDAGFLSYKDHLPVSQVVVGDTDRQGSEAKLSVGPLRCQGDSKFAQQLWLAFSYHTEIMFPCCSEDARKQTFSSNISHNASGAQ